MTSGAEEASVSIKYRQSAAFDWYSLARVLTNNINFVHHSFETLHFFTTSNFKIQSNLGRKIVYHLPENWLFECFLLINSQLHFKQTTFGPDLALKLGNIYDRICKKELPIKKNG